LAELFVSVVAETSSLDRALSRTHANLTTANVALGTFAGNIASTFARMAVGAAGGLFESTVRSASHLAESVNKTNVLFGDSAKIITDHANAMADVYSEPKQQILDITDNFALMGKEIGFSSDKAAQFGVKLSRMALDARSLGDAETAARKIEAALQGQSRPLRSLGVFINAATVKEEAARMGMQPGASGQLSEGQKIKARASLIENSEFMRKAAGDLERTLGQTENQTRKFWGTLSNLGTAIGEELNPAWNTLLRSFNSGLDDMKGYFEDNKSMIRGWGDSVVEGFNTALIVWRNLPDVLEIALLGADQKMEDARAKIEAWATSSAVSVESAFLKAAQSVGDFFKKSQDLVTTGASYGAAGLEKGTAAAQSAAQFTSDTWDAAVEAMGRKADVVFRPIRDFANFTERKAGLGDYKQMSVEEDIGRLKGGLSGLPKALGELGGFFKTYQDVAGESIKAAPTDFTSGLIDKANKHLADTLAQNSDISSRGIAAATARITAREAAHLNDLANQWIEDTEYDKMFPELRMGGDVQENLRAMGVKIPELLDRAKKGKGVESEVEGEDAAVLGGKTKHHKGLEDTASFLQNMAAQQLGGDVQERQLSELQQIREIDQKNADMMERMYNKTARAAYA
jgi:hypothetical protein